MSTYQVKDVPRWKITYKPAIGGYTGTEIVVSENAVDALDYFHASIRSRACATVTKVVKLWWPARIYVKT